MANQDNAFPGAVGPRTSVVAQQVEDSERMMALPRHFGQRLLAFEGAVYDFMRRFAADYDGAYWQFYELSNGGFYMAPDGGPFRISIDTNGYEGEMSADAAGITICLFACSHLSFRYSDDDVFGDHFHMLREFAAEHAEASAIFAAID
jgi:antirestriction protein